MFKERRRAIDLINLVEGQHDMIKFNDMFKEDLKWWRAFAIMFNGCASIIKLDLLNSVTMYSDASMLGFGANWDSDWFFGVWDKQEIKGFSYVNHEEAGPMEVLQSSAERELWPIVVSCKRWGRCWQNKAVHVFTDNTAVEIMLRTGRSRNKLCMGWLREIFWCSFVFNFEIFPHRISSAENVFCDGLSRVIGRKAQDVVKDYAKNRTFCCLSPMGPNCDNGIH